MFSQSKDDLGRTDILCHKINTRNAQPVKQAPRRLTLTQREVAENEGKRFLAADVICPSNSPWASPIVLVKRKDCAVRLCIGYRKVNSLTVTDS